MQNDIAVRSTFNPNSELQFCTKSLKSECKMTLLYEVPLILIQNCIVVRLYSFMFGSCNDVVSGSH
jgi:hypothetical protein